MSTCISIRGEYGGHDLPGTKFSEFDCNRCYAFVEEAALAEVARLRAAVVRVETLADRVEETAVGPQPFVFTRDVRAALAEPDETERNS